MDTTYTDSVQEERYELAQEQMRIRLANARSDFEKLRSQWCDEYVFGSNKGCYQDGILAVENVFWHTCVAMPHVPAKFIREFYKRLTAPLINETSKDTNTLTAPLGQTKNENGNESR